MGEYEIGLLLKLIIVATFIERAVAQIKSLVRTRSLYAILGTVIAFGLVYSYDLLLIREIVQHTAP